MWIYSSIFASVIVFVIYEHLARIYQWPVRALPWIKFGNEYIYAFFEKLGALWAYLSSFTQYLKLEEIFDTLYAFWDAIRPCFEALKAFWSGYARVAIQWMTPSNTIAGSILLLFGIIYGLYYVYDLEHWLSTLGAKCQGRGVIDTISCSPLVNAIISTAVISICAYAFIEYVLPLEIRHKLFGVTTATAAAAAEPPPVTRKRRTRPFTAPELERTVDMGFSD